MDKENKTALEDLSRAEILRKLFTSTLTLSAFTFGGGYVIVSLMKKTFVDELGWIDNDEMLDLVAIAQSAPGAIAVNGAIVIGYKLAGLLGVLVAIVATVIPPFVVISLISVFYEAFRQNTWIALILEGMQAGVGAVIASVVFDMGAQVFHSKNRLMIAVMFLAFFANYFLEINVVVIIGVAALLGIVLFFVDKHRRKELSE
ncbi:chromate transporter [Fundicoccus culcitae]|uniref:Chromate transporter n=1 Tax=Fundicoccus culcitae TaxID=2969821 RepID=A0ABY5P9C6_9LACT|nr:chromate transporter [Fundicoccus culcitae]UUX35348.1 chromate transporter [Fundicoccus culcitae]